MQEDLEATKKIETNHYSKDIQQVSTLSRLEKIYKEDLKDTENKVYLNTKPHQ